MRYKYELVVFVSAATIRFVSLFLLFPTDFWFDSYHHWQISMWSLKVGIPKYHKLLDPGGFAYFWLPLPHIVEMLLFFLSPSLTPFRVFNCVVGAFSAVLVNVIGSRFRNRNMGLMAGLTYAVIPVAFIHESLALIEPLTTVLLLFGVLQILEDRPKRAGVLFGLAALCRVEVLPIVIIFVLAIYHLFIRSEVRTFNSISFLILTILPYNVVLALHVGNPLAPWMANYAYNLRGLIKSPLVFMLGIGGLIIFIYLLKWLTRFSFYVLISIVTIYFSYIGAIYYIRRFVMGDILRYLVMPLPFIVLLVYSSLYSFKGRIRKVLQVIVFGLALASIYPCINFYQPYVINADDFKIVADVVSRSWTGGAILCDNQIVNYYLVLDQGIHPKNILGSYMFLDYQGLKEKDIRLLVRTSISWEGANTLYNRLDQDNLELISKLEAKIMPLSWSKPETIYIYRVK